MIDTMKPALLAHALCALFLSAVSTQAYAARPLVTDDARLTNAHSCQLESWTRMYQGGQELWAMPACNLGENLEVTLGGGSYHNRTEDYHTEDWVGQVKTLFKPLTSKSWGWGLAEGRVMHPNIQPGPNQMGHSYFYLPLSLSFADDDVVIHINAGLLHDQQQNRNKRTLGIGSEFQLGTRVRGIAEVFGDHTQAPDYQFGLRYAIVPELFQVDTTFGEQINGGAQSQWLSIGLRYTP